METKSRVLQAGGGVAIFIKSGINYERIDNIHPDLEGITIKLHSGANKITISCIYIPPNTPPEFYNHLQPLVSNRNTIICGDLNAKNTLWGSPKSDCRGEKVEELTSQSMVILNDGSGTRLNNDGSRGHLDLALASTNIAAKCNWEVHHDNWNSDHFPILIQLQRAGQRRGFHRTSLRIHQSRLGQVL